MPKYKYSEESKKTMRESKMGSKNPRWNDGASTYPNHTEFKRARIKVLKRSKGKCEICSELAKLVHHIDEDKSNHTLDNLIALCFDCHEPLHRDGSGKSVKGRPTKYGSVYGMPLREMGNLFGVVPSTIHYWIKNPEKKKWLENELKEIETKKNK